MVIERDARRFIYDLCSSKNDAKKFIKAIANVNAVANTQGQGRQDFKVELLELAMTLMDDSRQVN